MHPILLSTLSKYDAIILVGWGTGWHIQPIVNISWELREKNLLWIWWKKSEEEKVARENKVPFESISTLKLATTKSPKILLYPFVLIQGVLQARRILSAKIPTLQNSKIPICIFSKWGPGSVAIGIAGWTLGLPLYIHESDTTPGRSNRILGKFATKIFLGFESAKRYFSSEKWEVIGQILHPIFHKWKVRGEKWKIRWKTTKPHILVICGSQGSQVIFREILESFHNNDNYEWIIALGKLNASMKWDLEKMRNTQAFEWISQEDIPSLLENTQIAITRGSATTLAEIDVFRVRKIIIPLPYSAGNHQYWNAKEYEKTGDTLLEQKNLNQLIEIIQKICHKIINR